MQTMIPAFNVLLDHYGKVKFNPSPPWAERADLRKTPPLVSMEDALGKEVNSFVSIFHSQFAGRDKKMGEAIKELLTDPHHQGYAADFPQILKVTSNSCSLQNGV